MCGKVVGRGVDGEEKEWFGRMSGEFRSVDWLPKEEMQVLIRMS